MYGQYRGRPFYTSALAAIILYAGADVVYAQQRVQCFSLEFFYDSAVDGAAEIRTDLHKFAADRTGLKLTFSDVKGNPDIRKRIDTIAKYFQLSKIKLPAIYGLKNVLADLQTKQQMRTRLGEILTLTAFVRDGCPHCRAAKSFLANYGRRYPALRTVYREVTTDTNAQSAMDTLTRRYQQQAASLPVIHYCNGLTIGFDRDATTGRRILKTLDYWSLACSVEKKKKKTKSSSGRYRRSSRVASG